MAPKFRYFLGFQVDRSRAVWLADQMPRATGDAFRLARPDRLHLTLCTIEETDLRDPLIAGRVDTALAPGLPPAGTIRFGRLVCIAGGAELVTVGSKADVRNFYARTIARLVPHGLAPMHRKSGFRPHITVGYGRCRFEPVRVDWDWSPRQLVLIESHVGMTRHDVLHSWRLEPPAQEAFVFMIDETPPALRRAA